MEGWPTGKFAGLQLRKMLSLLLLCLQLTRTLRVLFILILLISPNLCSQHPPTFSLHSNVGLGNWLRSTDW